MNFPLSPLQISLSIAVAAVIVLLTSELLPLVSDYFGDFVVDKTRLRIAALVLGAAFLVSILVQLLLGYRLT